MRKALDGADLVLASDLTFLECERALVRREAAGDADELVMAERRAMLAEESGRWHRLHLEWEVLERAGRRFPHEPIRTLDAIHLACAIAARTLVAGAALLTLDERVRRAGLALGFPILPD